VKIGGALAEARSEAGLTITEVSKRTRIRETIIRDIERDDYSACGGDFYARGHIRAIARVVGTDPVPLIEQYDAARLPPPDPAAASHAASDQARARVSAVNGHPAAETGNGPVDGATSELPETVLDAARRRAAARKQLRRSGLANVPAAHVPLGITAAEAFRPGLPMNFERRRPRGVGLLVLLVFALIGVVIYLLVSKSSPSRVPATPPRSHPSAAAAAHTTAGSSASPAASSMAAVPLTIASAAAFGPAGTSQGDDPQGAPLAIDSSMTTAWTSDWYASSHLGGLQSGTGLLLSLANPATIATATVVLSATPGGTIELRAGNTPALADLPVVARSGNPGGALTMRLSVPVRARYALVWFTSLPPDGAGTYQVRVYDIRLTGNPA